MDRNDRVSQTIGTLLSAAVSALLHLFALLQLAAPGRSDGLPPDWGTHFRVLIGLSLVLLAVMYAVPSRRARVAAGACRLVVFLLLGIPYGRLMDVRYLLLFALLVDVGLALEPPAGAVLSLSALVASAVFVAPLSVFSIRRPPPGWLDLAAFWLLGFSLAGLLAALRRLGRRDAESRRRIAELNEAVSKLIGANRGYLEYAARAARESTASERNRITLELHDVVGQAFTNICAMMEASLKHPASGPEETGELHTWVREQARKGLNETRAILYKLRSIRDREPSGIQSLHNLLSTFRLSTRAKVDVEWGNLPWQIAPALDDALYHVVQEALINAFRHGHADQIAVRFWVDERALLLDIRDNGRGAAAGAKKGIGQESMEQRAAGVGGRVSFASTGQGYHVHAEFPL